MLSVSGYAIVDLIGANAPVIRRGTNAMLNKKFEALVHYIIYECDNNQNRLGAVEVYNSKK